MLEAIADRFSNFCIVELEIDGSGRALPAPVGLESLFNDIIDGVKSLIPLEFAAQARPSCGALDLGKVRAYYIANRIAIAVPEADAE